MRRPAAPRAALTAVLFAAGTAALAAPLPAEETATLADGHRLTGRLEWSAGRLWFRGGDPPRDVAAADLRGVEFPQRSAVPTAAEGRTDFAPHVVHLWGSERLSARLAAVDEEIAQIEFDGRTLAAPSGAVSAVFGPERWRAIVADDFEQPPSAWSGSPAPLPLDAARAFAGESSLRLEGECDLARAIDPPIADGELALRFFDAGKRVAGRQWLVELQFGPRAVRIVLGWDAGRIAVESPHGPSLVVRDVARAEGWRLLRVRFSRAGLWSEVDALPLAEGDAPPTALSGIRIATRRSPVEADDPPPEDSPLAGWIDELRVEERLGGGVSGRPDADQDIVVLLEGDELFGRIVGYSPDEVVLSGALGESRLPWTEIDGLYLRRRVLPADAVEGTIVGLHFAAPEGARAGRIARRSRVENYLEGAVMGLDDERLLLDHPRLGRVSVRRDALRSLEVLFAGRRLEIAAAAYHLGDEVRPELEIAAPDGPRLELPFSLDALPQGAARLALSVVGLEGEGSPFAPADENSPLRTDVLLNGRRLDHLNRHVLGTPATGVRIRLPLPADALQLGENRLVFEQAPSADDPPEYDDFGLWGVAIEEEAQ